MDKRGVYNIVTRGNNDYEDGDDFSVVLDFSDFVLVEFVSSDFEVLVPGLLVETAPDRER